MSRISRSKGFTLLELLMTLSILSFVIGLVFYAYTLSLRLFTDEFSDADASYQAHKALDRLSSELRGGMQLITTGTNEVSFWYQDLNNNGTLEANEMASYTWTGTPEMTVVRTFNNTSFIVANDILSFSVSYEAPGNMNLVKIYVTAQKNNVLSTIESSVNLRNL